MFDVSQQICNNDIYKSKGWLWINLNLLYSYIHYKLISLKKTWGMGLVGKVKCSTWDVARNPWESHISSTQYDLWGNSSVDTKCRIVSSHSTADIKVYGHIIGSNCARVANHHRYNIVSGDLVVLSTCVIVMIGCNWFIYSNQSIHSTIYMST